ncbi:ribosome rescue GTPase HflX [Salinibius halmophilus]|uniref:ribosome rescue GTPase HflX n=1 Tax=Salinibius halmophilus TaxID=1853216 RepID=UPI000E65F41B|nr:ribosome rescue GTPase HflX [Salinibius halmophilus]
MFFERHAGGDRAVLVHIEFPEGNEREDVLEFQELVTSAGAEVTSLVTGSRSKPDPKTYIGVGKLEELHAIVKAEEADVVIFNHALSPSQERNVESVIECRVLDRTGLILDIFAQRARTHEGKLQVELAQLEHQSTRLVRGWTHLERQAGGIGLRGPGETQLETDRRLLRARITTIKERLAKVQRQRDQNRRARDRSQTHSVAIVGYTNAGKSTLFNRITESDVYAADQLFATLDPTLRRFEVPDLGNIVLADTVGFIRHLPHKLVDAFKATLQETANADLLLHVVDAASDERQANIEQVQLVLKEIGADDIPQLMIYNKIDLLDDWQPAVEYGERGQPERLWLSAKSGEGCDLIAPAIAELLGDDLVIDTFRLLPQDGSLRAQLHAYNAVTDESYDENGEILLSVRIQRKDIMQIFSRLGISPERFIAQDVPDYLK